MRAFFFALIIALAQLHGIHDADAVVCAKGVYRAGCVGPNGAAVVRKAPVVRVAPVHRPAVACASGPYRAGCVGPRGGAVVRKPY